MVDREKVLAVLRKRFPEASGATIAAATNAVVGLDEEWEEVQPADVGVPAGPKQDEQLRIFRRREQKT